MSTEDKHRYNEYFSRLEVDDEDGSDYTDHWNSGELLCLASAVQRSGDKNWVSVSRAIKPYGEAKRPSDWYASKNCALQYSKLLKGVEDLKKKSLPRTERETSEELLVKNLTDKRLNELKFQNQLVLKTANVLQAQLEMLENGEFDDNLDEMLKHIEENDRNDKDEYKEWLVKRESLNQVKRLNKCRAPISKGKAPTSRSLESRRKNSPNPDHSDHDTLHSIAAEANIKIEVDSGEESPQLPKLKIKTEPEQYLLAKANLDDSRMHSPQISIPSSHPIPPTSPLLTSLLRNVASATPISSNSSPLKEISAEDLLQSAKLLNSEILSSRKSDPSQQIFLSPTQTSTSSISPLLTSLLKSPTAATPVSPISTNVITPSLPKEVDQFEALEPLRIPSNASEGEGASIPKTKDMAAHGHMSSHPVPATSPLLNSLLKSPNSNIPIASAAASLSPMQILQPKEATTAKSASPPQPFFNPASALASAAAQQLAVATASLPQNHHFFQQPDASNGRKSIHLSPINSATLSAPTLSKLLEMPPSTPGKLPPLPVIDSPSTVTAALLAAEAEASMQASTLFQTPPRNSNIPVQPDFMSLPKGVEDQKLDDAKAVDLLDAESAAILESNLGIDFTKAIGKDALDSFTFDDLEFEDAENILKALSNSTVKETIDAELEKTKNQNLGLLQCPDVETKLEKIIQPIVEVSSVTKGVEIEDETGANSKKFYKSRSTPKKRTSVEDEIIDKVVSESPAVVSPKISSKRSVRSTKQFEFDNDQFLSTESGGPPSSDQEETKESKDVKIEVQPPVSSKKPRLYEKKQTKESVEEETPYVRRPGPGRPKKFRGKVLKTAATKVEEEKDQYEFTESTEESSVGYQTTNTLCYMPRIKEESHMEETKVKSQDSDNAGSSKSTSKLEKKFFGVTQKIKQESSDNTSVKKALFTSDEDHLSDSLDVAEDVSKSQLPEEKIKNWRAMTEKQIEGSDSAAKAKLRKGAVAESSKNKQVKKTSGKSDKSRPAKKAKKQVKDATDSEDDEPSGFSKESESCVLITGEWQKLIPPGINIATPGKVKSEILSEMEVETNDSHVSSSIAAESDRQTDDMEGYESHQGSVTTDFSTPPLSAKEEKDRSRFGKQQWYQGSSPKGSEPVSQSSEDSEDYESDNSDNQSVSTNKSTSQSTETSRTKQKEKETPEYKAWKKSISIVWREASCHKFANVFSQKVTNDVAPGYLGIVNRPMDLSLIKKNIDNGVIRTTNEFMRDMMLMFQNAIMYNSSDHDVYQMARDMRSDVKNQLLDFYATQVKIKEKSGDQTTSSLRAARNAKAPKTPQSLPKTRDDAD